MHITIVAIGSRGDIQPYIALGQGLHQSALPDHVFKIDFVPHEWLFPRKKLSAEQLAQAIRLAVTEQPIRRRAAHIGELLRGEDGVQRAVEVFQRYYA